jgi:hypothetical protein
MAQLGKLLVFVTSALLSVAASAQDAPAPASFGEYADRFVSKIDFPDISAETPLNVRCAGHVTKRGVFDTILCLGDPEFKGDADLARKVGGEIAEVVRDVRLNAAKVDGSRVEVWYNFSVKFELNGGEENVSVVDHHFRNGDTDANYVAAQRYNGDAASCASRLKSAIFIEATVNADGEVESVEPVSADDEDCANELVAKMQESRYIPAHRNGAPVSSKYVEIFFQY